jgi:hypothetical protein
MLEIIPAVQAIPLTKEKKPKDFGGMKLGCYSAYSVLRKPGCLQVAMYVASEQPDSVKGICLLNCVGGMNQRGLYNDSLQVHFCICSVLYSVFCRLCLCILFCVLICYVLITVSFVNSVII